MRNPSLTKRQKQVRTHNIATAVALLAVVAIFAANLLDNEFVAELGILLILIMFASILVMYRTRAADEYIASVWRAGTSLAFVFTAAILLVTPLVSGFYAGYMGAHTGTEYATGEANGFLTVIASFFVGNAWARIRGTA